MHKVSSRFPEHLIPLQREVQRKLGRNLIRLQQYERLAKLIAANYKLEVRLEDLQAAKETATEKFANDTLGTVVKELKENFFCPPSDFDAVTKALSSQRGSTKSLFSLNFQIETTKEQFDPISQRISVLVALRNEMVHHFLDVQDVWTIEGCKATNIYLDARGEEINEHYEELRQWVKGLQSAQSYLREQLNAPEMTDFLLHGILPDGEVDWEHCTIVELLRNAEASLAQDGWTLLDDAKKFIGEKESDQTPEKYRCSSWPQVIHESRQFEIRKEKMPDKMPKRIWYRTRPQ